MAPPVQRRREDRRTKRPPVHEALRLTQRSEKAFDLFRIAAIEKREHALVIILLGWKQEIPLLDLVVKVGAEGGWQTLEQPAIDHVLNRFGCSDTHLPPYART